MAYKINHTPPKGKSPMAAIRIIVRYCLDAAVAMPIVCKPDRQPKE
jgi:hypothetical protein